MSKITYSSLKVKPHKEVKEFSFNEKSIEVTQYLSAQEKYDLIMITLQKAEENGYYNPYLMDLFFHLHLVYMYTNLTFTDKQREDELELYDALEQNGFMEAFLNALPESEYDTLYSYVTEVANTITQSKESAGSVIARIVNDLPTQAAAAREIVENFDPQQYQRVIDFANAANGGRSIVTNQ